MTVRLYVKEWREHLGLTQQVLADRTGMDVAAVSRLERGDRDWSGRQLSEFSKALGIEPAKLLAPPT